MLNTCYLYMREPILVIYDGHCKLCSCSVRWITRNDVHKNFSFLAQQTDRVDSIVTDTPIETVMLMLKGKRYERSSAVLRIAVRLRFPWPLLGIFFLVPRFIRDSLYDLVARNRKQWFGERSNCHIQ